MRLSHIIYISAAVLLLTACGAEWNMRRGQKSLTLGEYYDAARQFAQAYRRTEPADRKLRGERARMMAECYDKINMKARAAAGYANAMRYHQLDAKGQLAYARALLATGDYKKAATLTAALADSTADLPLLDSTATAAATAQQMKKQGSTYKVKALAAVNSRRDDYSPVLTGDDYSTLYFTSTRNEAEGTETSGITGAKAGDIFYSKRDDKGRWSKPIAADGALNTEYDEGACSFSPDQQTMYLTQCLTDPAKPCLAQIVTSKRSDAAWGKVQQMKITADSLSAYAHPAVSPDGRWLYFVSDMPGGMGGYDIWRAQITADGQTGAVENLGAPVNTAGDEMFPTFRPNGDLYFSSNGHPGLGGLDIFYVTVDPATRHFVLHHPGYPLNSEGDDLGMTFEGAHNRGFFASNRRDARGYDHIYSFESNEITHSVTGWVYETDGYELPAADVRVVGDDGTQGRLTVHGDGSFQMSGKPGVSYLILATCKGYLNHMEQITMPDERHSCDTTLQFSLASITAPVLIDNIFYDFDKATLSDSSAHALDGLVKLLNDNPHITIELAAHTDRKGPDAYNNWLSQKRAEAVVDYLVRHGIARDRLTPKGYGKQKPKQINKRTAARYTWLKEGDVLTEAFIAKLPEDKQAICDQLNRRTEFSVLRTTYHLFDSDGKLIETPKPAGKPDNDGTSDSDDTIFEWGE